MFRSILRIKAVGFPNLASITKPKCTRLQSSKNSPETRVEDLVTLRTALDVCIQAEDYASAARLRDEIQRLEDKDPLRRLETELENAVKEDRFEDAARLRDQIVSVRPPKPPIHAFKTTEGVKVEVTSEYHPYRSQPTKDYFFFAYDITITNTSEANGKVKLMGRYWNIKNGTGSVQEVRGSGVVGEQPVLGFGESFTYQSFCPLTTPTGEMEGSYEFYKMNDQGSYTTSFLVEIPKFRLDASGYV
jgi:ApaG protein